MPVTFRAHIRSGHLDNIPTQLVEKSAAMHVGLPLIRMELAIIFNGDLQIDISHIQSKYMNRPVCGFTTGWFTSGAPRP